MPKINDKVLKYLENDPSAVWAVSHLSGARNAGFYGKITIQFEAGSVVLIRKEQTQKPPKIIMKEDNKNGKSEGN